MDFLHFGIIDIIDILAVVFLVYQVYRLLKGTVAINILLGMAIIFLLWKLVSFLHMELLGGILDRFVSVGIILIVVVFQQEIRRFLIMVGSANNLSSIWSKITKGEKESKYDNSVISELVRACFNMAERKEGALIVLKRRMNILKYITSGDLQKIEVTQTIIESIFYKNSPLHDGAVIIEDNQIVRTRAILPVSEDNNVRDYLGLRHRAALGLCEKSDAICVVVSEERGVVSFVKGSTIRIETKQGLEKALREELEL